MPNLGPFRTHGVQKSRSERLLREISQDENANEKRNKVRATPHESGKGSVTDDTEEQLSSSQEPRDRTAKVHSRVRHSYFQRRRKPRPLCDSKGSTGSFTNSTGSTGGSTNNGSSSAKPILAHRLFSGSGSLNNNKASLRASGRSSLQRGNVANHAERAGGKSNVSDTSTTARQSRSERTESDPKTFSTSKTLNNTTEEDRTYGFDTLSLDGSASSDQDNNPASPIDREVSETRAPNCPRIGHKYSQKTTNTSICTSVDNSCENDTASRGMSNSRKTAAEPTTGRGLSILTPKSKKPRRRMETRVS